MHASTLSCGRWFAGVPPGGIAPPHQASETRVTIYVQRLGALNARMMVGTVGIEPTTDEL